ncbi:MAG TPA: tripartite tricarboxylate transporter substrate binding protein [Pseudolabrys sp.]|jgi:tripartite-type tricarboxylate transporter receptor subunit TctC|uniref:Bug family tripartite tricarboxylate transporter substrate binding protein n=1 Tax=Pseudolabrys sp. TaxID=1960880 RepID=UPI002DDD3EDF|nr:tripartite tricarboxylate transporter substrate binding protein [Pseudolabrys sp.]HEV2629493.1 tripartite tricarboxylate transporter substrate binding protein [Pseudolabrys sp.]
MTRKRYGLALALLLALTGTASAQDFPSRPMTMIIPFAAGGPTDVLGRVIAQRMGEILKQNVIVENVGGAGGMTGSKRVAEAKPDGYTFGIGTVGTHAQNQSLYARPAYNASTDFTPVALIAEVPIVLIARNSLPVNNLKEFVAYAKANEAKMSFGSGGAGSASHLGCVVMNMAMGTHITHVPYKGGGPAMQDVMAGRLDFECEIMSTVKPHIDAGQVKGLAILAKTRSPALPNVPTALEQGFDAQAYTWNAVFLPKGAPPAIVKKLNEAVLAAMHTPAVRERLAGFGAQIVPDDQATPDYLAGFVKSEIVKWRGPIQASGVQIK